jgi:hypothetical protein
MVAGVPIFDAWQMFDSFDSGDDRRIHIMEKLKSAIPVMEKYFTL